MDQSNQLFWTGFGHTAMQTPGETPLRNRLQPETVEMLTVLRSNKDKWWFWMTTEYLDNI